MQEKEALEILQKQLEELKSRGVANMMKEGRVEELRDVSVALGESFFDSVDKYLHDKLFHQVDEEYVYELVLYIFNSSWPLWTFLSKEAVEQMIEVLEKDGEPSGLHIVSNVRSYNDFVEDCFFNTFSDRWYEEELEEVIGA